MKSIKYLAIFVLIITLLPLTVNAQEFSPDTVRVIVQPATSGTLEANDDDTYTLTLEGVLEQVFYLENPTQASGALPTSILVTGWEATEDPLVAPEAYLETGEVSLTLTLSSPDYSLETGTLTYIVTITAVDGEEKFNTKGLVSDFENAVLFIQADNLFLDNLYMGLSNAGLRCPTCDY